VSPDRLVFRMRRCRVQEARERQGLTPFPVTIGLVEYGGFARTIDRGSRRVVSPAARPEAGRHLVRLGIHLKKIEDKGPAF